MHVQAHRWLKWPTLVLTVLCVGIFSYGIIVAEPTPVEGRVVLPARKADPPWRTFEADEVDHGISIPSDTNVIFHIPTDVGRITRKVLFGMQSTTIRYWGYCFPDGYDFENPVTTHGFPGKVFLSEAERAVREKIRQQMFPDISIYRPPTKTEVRARENPPVGRLIRHQLEVFHGNQTCYVMTAQHLPLGTDRDGDLLNSKVEDNEATDPNNADTDGDGVTDGLEVLSLNTSPLRRDTDTDGLIDGIEDANRNGRLDTGETNPLEKDSDRDNLCDGFCRLPRGGRVCTEFSATRKCVPSITAIWRGEDKNLNGLVDEKETDPLNADSDGDGITDEQELFNCLLEKKQDC